MSEAPPPEPPAGLLGLLLQPLQAAVSAGLALFVALLNGILGALIPGAPSETQGDDEDDAPQ